MDQKLLFKKTLKFFLITFGNLVISIKNVKYVFKCSYFYSSLSLKL